MNVNAEITNDHKIKVTLDDVIKILTFDEALKLSKKITSAALTISFDELEQKIRAAM